MEKINQISPSLKEFKKIAKGDNVIPISYSFYADWLTPLNVYHNLRNKIKGENFLLESVEGQEKICRFSFLGFKPLCVFKTKGREIFIQKDNKSYKFKTQTDPLEELKKITQEFKLGCAQDLPFFGGFVGYIGYDTIHFYEPIGERKFDPLKIMDTYLILPKFVVVFDHIKRKLELISFIFLKNKKNLDKVYKKEVRILKDIFNQIITPKKLDNFKFLPSNIEVKSNMSKRNFLNKVKQAKEHINKGDIIQVVLSQRFSMPYKDDPFTAYRYLRILNPSPYMFYLDFNRVQLAGSSPEMLLRCQDQILITRPIAGTRPRSRDEEEDKKLETDLLADPKEKAEHIMLVDLARNDLGRVAAKGTVEIPIFMKVERFSHVMHIVSEVKAKLDKDRDLFSALRGCFPAGTLTGAPKVRAMQIINQLENQQRAAYGGCVGYFSFTNSLDTCIIIRTIIFKDDKAYVQAGAGIVSDSVPENEYNETMNKAKAQILALRLAKKNR